MKKIKKIYPEDKRHPHAVINELIDAVNEMSEGCEHHWVAQFVKNDASLTCTKCGEMINTPKDKQEEEVQIIVKTNEIGFPVSTLGRKTMPKSKARRLGLID